MPSVTKSKCFHILFTFLTFSTLLSIDTDHWYSYRPQNKQLWTDNWTSSTTFSYEKIWIVFLFSLLQYYLVFVVVASAVVVVGTSLSVCSFRRVFISHFQIIIMCYLFIILWAFGEFFFFWYAIYRQRGRERLHLYEQLIGGKESNGKATK